MTAKTTSRIGLGDKPLVGAAPKPFKAPPIYRRIFFYVLEHDADEFAFSLLHCAVHRLGAEQIKHND